jgi:hypothetical protein
MRREIDRARKDEAVIVIGVFPDQIDPPRGPENARFGPEPFSELGFEVIYINCH